MDSQETKIYTAILIAAGVLGVIVIYFIINIIRQQRRTQRLNQEKIQAEIMTMEKDRARISSDLHDELGPILSAIKFKINSVDHNSNEDEQVINQASDHIDEIIRRIREIANDLMPHTLTRKGVVYAIEEFVDKAARISPIRITFRHHDVPHLPSDKSINLYRITQEIVHNAIKHSKASELIIELRTDKKNIILITKDNGVGFDHARMDVERSGLGLRNLQSRTEIMHGELSVESSKGKGVQHVVQVPIN